MTYPRRFFVVALAAAFAAPLAVPAQLSADEALYRTPPRAILDVLRAPQLPIGFVSPSHDTILLATPLRYPPVADLARPMLRIAGLRIDPQTNGIHHASSYDGYALVRVADGKRIPVALPAHAHASAPVWSPNGSRFAFANATPHGIDLYVGTTATGAIRKLDGVRLNTVFGNTTTWLPDGKTLLVYLIPAKRGAAPAAPAAPSGPIVQQSNGKKAPAVTFEDLLSNPYDEALFEYYASGRYVFVDVATAHTIALTPLGIYRRARIAPSANAFLIDRIHRPFSYAVPHPAFPHEMSVVDRAGKLVRRVVDVPLQENATFQTVPTGPRDVVWRADKPATLVWSETQDGGDPSTPAPIRDIVYQADATAAGVGRPIVSLAGRFEGISFVAGSSLAIAEDYDRDTRITRALQLDLDAANPSPVELSRLRDGDRYHDPGRPVTRLAANGESVVVRDGDAVFLRGAGAGPDGRRPFRSEGPAEDAAFPIRSRAAGERRSVARRAWREPAVATAVADGSTELRRSRRRFVERARPDCVRRPDAATPGNSAARRQLQAPRRRRVVVHPLSPAGI
jgi:dipeptidyl aminopeptidase/acylaminoacyl peptidase